MRENTEFTPSKHAKPIYACKNITIYDNCVAFDLMAPIGPNPNGRSMTLAIKKNDLKEMLKDLLAETEVENDLGEK